MIHLAREIHTRYFNDFLNVARTSELTRQLIECNQPSALGYVRILIYFHYFEHYNIHIINHFSS